MTKTKLILTNNEAQALITMIAAGGDSIAVTPRLAGLLMRHFMSLESSQPTVSECAAFSNFVRSIRKIVDESHNYCIEHSSVNIPHIRITIEVDPTKDFTKPTTDLSQLTITE